MIDIAGCFYYDAASKGDSMSSSLKQILFQIFLPIASLLFAGQAHASVPELPFQIECTPIKQDPHLGAFVERFKVKALTPANGENRYGASFVTYERRSGGGLKAVPQAEPGYVGFEERDDQLISVKGAWGEDPDTDLRLRVTKMNDDGSYELTGEIGLDEDFGFRVNCVLESKP